ncbi:MAG: carbamoyltransferase HypF [Phycisphaerales bacterium]|nr:carbamoyltransferase HypF [Phycisphaerales bacterium]
MATLVRTIERPSSRFRRLRLVIRGAVQGVGFRPFVYRLATELELTGWVKNSPQGVFIEVEGDREQLERFLRRIPAERPRLSSIQSYESSILDPVCFDQFVIRPSENDGAKTAVVLPDIATCSDCLDEILDRDNRRYGYPFTNCTLCGPRYSIIRSLPYDRPNTSMKSFQMCERCQKEYDDPSDRRFHAQPNACPICGPQLALWDECGQAVALRHSALLRAVEAIRDGRIVAVKGLGGFHLMLDAGNASAVRRLRTRKHREEKPFALMFPSVEEVRARCEISEAEERLLSSPASPIVLLRRRTNADAESRIDPAVAPDNPCLGVMLPSTPLHHLLMRELGFPLVATSGNLSDEPICTDEYEAVNRLRGIADWFLVHDRPIVRHVDDSIARVVAGREMILRRARGYAPLPVPSHRDGPSVLAVGAHLKNTIAISKGPNVFISQHIGDLETVQALNAFRESANALTRLYDTELRAIACDMHPDYVSTKHAKQFDAEIFPVQHHHAHVVACMAENDLTGTVLGVSWDGTGYGCDGTVWGGEFLLATESDFRRVGHLRGFHLPGGERAVKEPRRSAVGLLYEVFGDKIDGLHIPPIRSFSPVQRSTLKGMLARGANSPYTTSMGRMFDAVAALLDIRQKVNYEGQAAMALEFAVAGAKTDACFPFRVLEQNHDPRDANVQPGPVVLDWEPMVRAILEDLGRDLPKAVISAKFHHTVVEMLITVARRIGQRRIVLTGGCFQNQYLLERAVCALEDAGFCPYWHQRVPPNDGGIALGQAVVAISRMQGEGSCA